VHVRGHGRLITRITGSVTHLNDGSYEDLRIFVPSTHASNVAFTWNVTNGSARMLLNNVFVEIFKTVDAALVCVMVTGVGNVGICYLQNCYLYAHNLQLAPGPNARCVVFMADTNTRGNIEAFNCHGKTSSGATGVAKAVFAWVKVSTSYSSVHAACCDLAAIYSPLPTPLINENPHYTYPMMDVTVHTWTPETVLDMAQNINPEGAYYSKEFQNLYAAAFMQYYGGETFQLAPIVSSTLPPTTEDDAPDGTVWLVSP
jgi:hypothetical protein